VRNPNSQDPFIFSPCSAADISTSPPGAALKYASASAEPLRVEASHLADCVPRKLVGRDLARHLVVTCDRRAPGGDGRARDRQPLYRQLGLDPIYGTAQPVQVAWTYEIARPALELREPARIEAAEPGNALAGTQSLVQRPDQGRSQEQGNRFGGSVPEQPALEGHELGRSQREPGEERDADVVVHVGTRNADVAAPVGDDRGGVLCPVCPPRVDDPIPLDGVEAAERACQEEGRRRCVRFERGAMPAREDGPQVVAPPRERQDLALAARTTQRHSRGRREGALERGDGHADEARGACPTPQDALPDMAGATTTGRTRTCLAGGEALAQERQHVVRVRVPPQHRLREDELAVEVHVEDAALSRHDLE
jgi:hypothetical protein